MRDPIAFVQVSDSDTVEPMIVALARERELRHMAAEVWQAPDDSGLLRNPADEWELIASAHWASREEALYEHADWKGLLVAARSGGTLSVRALGSSPDAVFGLMNRARATFPPGTRGDEPDVVTITFWTNSPQGPRQIRRFLDAPSWKALEGNYAGAEDSLGRMMGDDFAPGQGGQLILWTGEPGTGKTTALRALAREWREWCDFHYVVDPEQFFGSSASYMLDVMLSGGEDEPIALDAPEVEPHPLTKGGRWRLLILEDCGEMLQRDARREVGQALARLLNTCDGLIGQGLKVLVLITTNEDVGKLHEAVARPGRCAARLEFERFGLTEAHEWLARRGIEPHDLGSRTWTLADLYDRLEGEVRIDHEARNGKAVGFGA